MWRALILVLLLTAVGDAIAVVTVGGGPAPAIAAVPAGAGPRTEVAVPAPSAPAPAGPVTPSALSAPSIGLASGVVGITVGPDRILAAPDDTTVAGWWSQGAVPGEPGPAVIVGHVDSFSGPGVFLRINELRPGDPLRVARSDGKVATFVVDGVEQYRKDDLPTQRVYGATPAPALRLITCGGRFDRRTRTYEDNVVVYARQAQA